jgi:hypothetical protein
MNTKEPVCGICPGHIHVHNPVLFTTMQSSTDQCTLPPTDLILINDEQGNILIPKTLGTVQRKLTGVTNYIIREVFHLNYIFQFTGNLLFK